MSHKKRHTCDIFITFWPITMEQNNVRAHINIVFVYHSDEFDFYVFALMHWLSWEPLCEPNFYVFPVLGATSGCRVKLAGRKSALNPPVVYSIDRSKAVVLVLFLLCVALWFILRGDLFYVLPCVIWFLCFSVLLALPES